jgi:hypothetical protein
MKEVRGHARTNSYRTYPLVSGCNLRTHSTSETGEGALSGLAVAEATVSVGLLFLIAFESQYTV